MYRAESLRQTLTREMPRRMHMIAPLIKFAFLYMRLEVIGEEQVICPDLEPAHLQEVNELENITNLRMGAESNKNLNRGISMFGYEKLSWRWGKLDNLIK